MRCLGRTKPSVGRTQLRLLFPPVIEMSEISRLGHARLDPADVTFASVPSRAITASPVAVLRAARRTNPLRVIIAISKSLRPRSRCNRRRSLCVDVAHNLPPNNWLSTDGLPDRREAKALGGSDHRINHLNDLFCPIGQFIISHPDLNART